MTRALAILSICLLPRVAWSFALELPIACELGKDCFVQNYMDHDPGPGSRDYHCGSQSYDAHNGTDIRVPTTAAMRRGVQVLAAADGRVLRVRDGVPDQAKTKETLSSAQGVECGNGIVIQHEDGYETQYCHLAQGSVLVKPGDQVQKRQPIGRVGLSGFTQFPHVHLTVRKDGQTIDPFASQSEDLACPLPPTSPHTVWADDVVGLQYRPAAILNKGFSTAAVSNDDIEQDKPSAETVSSASKALVAFVRVIGLQKGDIQRLRVIAPSGGPFADSNDQLVDNNKAQAVLFVGRKAVTGLEPGRYVASYVVTRGGQAVISDEFSLAVAKPN